MEALDQTALENLPGIFMIGSFNVGKRTLLSRLLSMDIEDASDSSTEVIHRWAINTKYYTADVFIWMTHLHDKFSIATLPIYDRIAALVMVFDTSDLSSLVALQEWVSHTDIQKFEILLCIGNKVDLIPGHPVHAEYRRRLQNLAESSADPYSEFNDWGISQTEGSSLLGDEESSWEIRRSCLEWCSEHSIEYIEACATNADFDKCLSVDGDLQGVDRLYGALSAHMWPGMILKSGNKINEQLFPEKEELSEEESDYEFEYEVLSACSTEPWDDTHGGWISANGSSATPTIDGPVTHNNDLKDCDHETIEKFDKEELQPSTSIAEMENDKRMDSNVEGTDKETLPDEVTPFDFEDLEQLMSEIGNIRDGLRFMPDFQRREMAAKLAMKMAAMFGGDSDDKEEFD